MKNKISACITCYNEEAKIERCLRSLTWCDEIVIVDSYSEDHTVEVCKRYTEKVHLQKWLGYIGQKNWVSERAEGPWILFLDADEEVSPMMRAAIEKEFAAGPAFEGYKFPRQVFYLGRWIRHGAWYPDVKLRLFLKDKGKSAGVEPHDHVDVEGRVKVLNAPIWHYTYDDMHDHVRQTNRFSTISAEEKFKNGVRFVWRDFLFRPPWRFVKGYFVSGGFREGFHGLVIAIVAAFEVALKYAKLRELEINQQLDAEKEAKEKASPDF